MRPAGRFALGALLVLPAVSGVVGQSMGTAVLYPQRAIPSEERVVRTKRAFGKLGTAPEDFEVRAPDGILLRGWKVSSRQPNSDWVLLFHGVADNRLGMTGYAEFLLRAGYGVVMMDARAHGASEGVMATYGWKERDDTRAVVDALYAREPVHCLFALGESMGAAIALQSAAREPRISGVVAESAFATLEEVSYDYAGLHLTPWLGKTLFRPAAYFGLRALEKQGGLRASEASPERAVAERAFPVLLICGTRDRNIPCRHSERILRAATGPKQLLVVQGAGHSAAFSQAPAEFERRVLAFLSDLHGSSRGAPLAQ